jgi:hypothetical protein
MLGSGDTPQKAAVSRRLGCPPAPDRRRRRYTCRGARSSAPLEIAPGRRGRAAHRSSAPFFTPQNRTSSSSSSSPLLSPTISYTTATPPGPSTIVESTKSRLDSLAPPLAGWFVYLPRASPCSWISPICHALLSRHPVAAGAPPPQLMPCMSDLFPQIGTATDMLLLPRWLLPCHIPSLRSA